MVCRIILNKKKKKVYLELFNRNLLEVRTQTTWSMFQHTKGRSKDCDEKEEKRVMLVFILKKKKRKSTERNY